MEKPKNREEAEKLVTDETKEIFSSSSTPIDILRQVREKTEEVLRDSEAEVQINIEKMIKIRGHILETSVMVEHSINEIILSYYLANKYKEFREDIIIKTLSFGQKFEILAKIIKRHNLQENTLRKEFLKDLQKFIEIRNVYAHAQEDVFDANLSIQHKPTEYIEVKKLNQEFFLIAQNMNMDLKKFAEFITQLVARA